MERGVTVWLTSASGAAAREMAALVAEALAERELPVELLHAERPGCAWIGDPRGFATVAALLGARGVWCVVAEADASRAMRENARSHVGALIEVLVVTDAPAGPAWQAPPQAEAEVDAAHPGAGVSRVLRTLEVLGYLRPREDQAYSTEEEREVIKRLKAFGYM